MLKNQHQEKENQMSNYCSHSSEDIKYYYTYVKSKKQL